jgi:putative tricarboxylic transport membrane protein
MRRREFVTASLAGTALSALSPLLSQSASAQTVDSLKMFIPAAPGGGWDQTGRSIEQVMKSAGLVKNMPFENVAGAGGTVGLPRFINMRGQQNVLMVSGMVMVGAIIANKSPVNLTQVTPVARLIGEVEAVVVPAASPHKTMKDLAAALKKDTGAVSWAGGSAGGTDHILAGLIAQDIGADPKKVSYVAYSGGGPANAAIIGNQVTAGIGGWAEVAEHVKAGKMRCLGVSSEKRLDGVNVPTLKEGGVNVELYNWRGVFAPPGIPAPHRQALTDLVDRMYKTKQWQDEMKNRDWIGLYMPGDKFGDYIKTETTRIETVLKSIGLA